MSLHADARAVLRDWSAPDDAQEELRGRYVACLDQGPSAVRREGRPDHLTASAVVFSADHRQVLLALHGRVRRWLQTGGHCEDQDDSLAATALRESREESGIHDLTVDPLPLLLSAHPAPCRPRGARDHLDVQFVAVAAPGARPHRSDESLEVRWFEVGELPDDTDDSVRALVSAAVQRLAQGRQASSSQGSPAAAETPSR